MTKIPEWLPDWTDESQYTDHEDNRILWAWEFLRRNTGYQADWELCNRELTDDQCNAMRVQLAPNWDLISPIPNPATSKPYLVFRANMGIQVIEQYNHPEYGWQHTGELPEDPNKVAIVFDRQRSKNKQLSWANKVLSALQREYFVPRNHIHLFIKYLRTHDAFTYSADIDDIRRVLHPNDINSYQTVKDHKDSADRLVQSDYRNIPP